jgi:hypothetical protein
VATIILVATVLTATLKAAVFRWSILIGVVATVGGLALGVFVYKLVRGRAAPTRA